MAVTGHHCGTNIAHPDLIMEQLLALGLMSLGPTTGQEPAGPGPLPVSHDGNVDVAPPLTIPNDPSATAPHAALSTLDIQDTSDKPNKMGDSAPSETDDSTLSEPPLSVSVSDQPSAWKELTSSALDEPSKEPDSEDAKPSSNIKTGGETKSDSEAEPSAKADGKRKAPAGEALKHKQHCLDCIHHDLKCVIPPSYLPLLEAYIAHVKKAIAKKNFSGSFWHLGGTCCSIYKASNKPPCMVGILIQELGPGYHSRNITSITTFPVPTNPSIKPVKSVKPATSHGSKSKIKSKQIVEDSDPKAESEDDKNVNVKVTAPPHTVTAPTCQASAGPSGVLSFSSISPVPAPTFDAVPIIDAINMLQVTSLLRSWCLRYLLVLPVMETPKLVMNQYVTTAYVSSDYMIKGPLNYVNTGVYKQVPA
ncbi:hypothetical protein BDZ97DRAFT_1923114 [Flammula alnicola]|nr:hypothetical protein BDZ97DRAFT_1923114 [Flammula alnicola]